jgi:holliday junction DNA helicase RuvA
MLAYLKGTLVEKNPTNIIIDIHGVGFNVIIPVSSFDKLGDTGEEALILTHLHVREDAMILFGFVTKEEKELFELLLSVSGVGPKLAIGILSGAGVEEFKNYIYHKNLTALTSISGIGKKTAERLIVELFDKISKQMILKDIKPIGSSEDYEIKNQAIQALCILGYARAVAEKSVTAVLFTSAEPMALEDIIKKALKITSK